MSSSSKKHYPEIDGLRAIAVLFVLIFHLNPNGLFKGGYIGVDVFFVISGYLITNIIYHNIINNNFNYFKFLGRRIARLYPALLLVIFLIIVLGFLIYGAESYITASKTIRYTLFSLSNLRFMKERGYWDAESTENPLLHTWSLGVEQQFYLFFPLVLLLTYEIFKSNRSIIIALIAISVISFCIAQYLSTTNSSANFYFTLSRLFELGIGGFFAIVGNSLKNISNSKKEMLFVLGLVMILIGAIFYENGIEYHPGVMTIPVVIGSVLCILYGDAKYSGLIVRFKAVVYIGAISYSIYLIHWPLIVFYKYLFQQTDLTGLDQIILLCTTLVIAALMYHFVENKYRRISISIFTPSGKVFLTAFLAVLLINFNIYYFNGIPQRLIAPSEQVIKQSTFAGSLTKYSNWNKGLQVLGDKTQNPIAIFAGDSYLGQYVEQIDLFFKLKHKAVYVIGTDACRLVDRIYHEYGFDYCLNRTKEYIHLLKDNQLPVIRINNWDTLNGDTFYNDKKEIIKINQFDILNQIIPQINSHATMMIIPQPYFNFSFNQEGQTLLYESINRNNKCNVDSKRISANLKIKDFLINNKTAFIEIYDLFCDQNKMKIFNNSEQGYNYSYTSHLSRAGSKLVWDNIGEQIYQFILDHKQAH